MTIPFIENINRQSVSLWQMAIPALAQITQLPDLVRHRQQFIDMLQEKKLEIRYLDSSNYFPIYIRESGAMLELLSLINNSDIFTAYMKFTLSSSILEMNLVCLSELITNTNQADILSANRHLIAELDTVDSNSINLRTQTSNKKMHLLHLGTHDSDNNTSHIYGNVIRLGRYSSNPIWTKLS